MTDARVSQLPVEVVRTNLAVSAQVSQLAIEVLRPNAPYGLTADAGSFALTGQDAALKYMRVVRPAAGTLTLSGQDAGSLRSYIFSVTAGSFVETGQNAGLLRTHQPASEAGAFALTGQDAAKKYSQRWPVNAGSFSLTGEPAGSLRTYIFRPSAGTFELTGNVAGSIRPGRLFAYGNSFTLTGQSARTLYSQLGPAAAGSYSLTGNNANLKLGYRIAATAGAFTLSGALAGSVRSYRLHPAVGSFALTGQTIAKRQTYIVPMTGGAFTLSGQNAFLSNPVRLIAQTGSYTLAGGPAWMKFLRPDAGGFALTGQSTALIHRHARAVSEMVYIKDPAIVKWSAATATADAFRPTDHSVPARGQAFAEGVGFGETLGYVAFPTAIVEELITLTDAASTTNRYYQTLLDSTRIADALSLAYSRTLTDAVTIADAADVVRGMIVLESLRLLDFTDGDATYYTQLAEGLKLSDSLRRFLAGALTDAITAGDTLALAPQLAKVLTESFTLADTATGKLLVRVTATDTFSLDDDSPANWIFHPTLTDQIEIAIGYVSPGGDFTTWAVNTRTGAVTEYSNYEFNSFAYLGHKYLGTSSAGLYELNGDTDAGANIIPHIKSGYAQFGGSKYSSFKAAYLGMRGSGDIILKLDTGDGKTYTYQTVVQDMQSTKVRLGKGLRARYFAFELIGTGPDFDLDTVEFIPLVAQRRV